MKLIQRTYQGEGDYWAIRDFLRDLYVRNGHRELAWPVARLDYWRCHCMANLDDGNIDDSIFIWEDARGRIVAVLNREDPGQVYFQVDPRHRTPELEACLLDVAEKHLTTIGKKSGREVLAVWVTDGDTLREELLAHRGYKRQESWQHYGRYRDLALPIPDVPPPDGYTIRPLKLEEIPSRSWASWRAFHPDEPDTDYQGSSWYENILSTPLYRRDLDLVAIAGDGSVASFCTIWYDDVTRSGYYEPVGTVPEHQRHGLATALLYEGMRRLRERGAAQACLGGGGASNPAAEGVYARVFGNDRDSATGWLKYFDEPKA
ncbi:GNAT family N-acetyltransferase [Candidatus Bipolaricaulota bacterium]|nr:GNAT family N-acetyltransferase [Candidatus Bipolaricaulota bacterium]